MEYVIIGLLAAAFGVSATIFAYKLKTRKNEQSDEEE